jgi:NAD(P)-dependent dehydrogenase (short-subunit alcohol dehydrogenase family)
MNARSGKVAIITAASSGIGAAAARGLAERGWRVALFARSEKVEALARELGGLAVRGDITNPADLELLVDRTLAEWGRIDGAAISTGHPAKGELTEIADEDWHRALDLVLMPTVRLSRLLLPVFSRQHGGSIVAVSSYAAIEPDPMFPLSAAFRAALSSYVRMFARRHAAAGVRINAVLPGFMDSYPESPAIVARIPTGRYGRVGELASTIAFLLSDEAGYVTGQNLLVDGGLVSGL